MLQFARPHGPRDTNFLQHVRGYPELAMVMNCRMRLRGAEVGGLRQRMGGARSVVVLNSQAARAWQWVCTGLVTGLALALRALPPERRVGR